MSDEPMKCLVLGGKTGLFGQSLVDVLEENGWAVLAAGRDDLDIFDSDAVAEYLVHNDVKILFNTVAYTLVDQAEDEPDRAATVNKTLPNILGKAVKKSPGVKLVHYSTDFVFDGRKDSPYTPDDEPNPLCIYGKSKLEGEKALSTLDLDDAAIIRTAWLFGPYKNNFVDKIIELAKDRPLLRVVHDQIGSPTYTRDLALYSLKLVEKGGKGIFHIANSGKASWCELATEAVTCMGLNCEIQAVTTEEYPLKAVRPAYSVLDSSKFTELTGVSPRPWIKALRDYLFQKKGELQCEISDE